MNRTRLPDWLALSSLVVGLGFVVVLGTVVTGLAKGFFTQRSSTESCPPPPETFSETSLVGTWAAGWSEPGRPEDTLIIRADGTYKQIIHLAAIKFDYESDWQPWRIEYAQGGLPYLHMTAMRPCAYYGGERISCEVAGGGTTDWYDPCQEKWVKMSGEAVLIVMGTPQGFIPSLHGIKLFLLQKGEDVWGYELQP